MALEREKEEPRTKEMARQLAAAAKAVDSIAATHGQLAMRLREAEAEARRHQGSGAPELPSLQLQMRGLARRCARRCAWIEPRARLCRHLALLEAGLPLSLRTDAVGSGDPPELSSRWCCPQLVEYPGPGLACPPPRLPPRTQGQIAPTEHDKAAPKLGFPGPHPEQALHPAIVASCKSTRPRAWAACNGSLQWRSSSRTAAVCASACLRSS